MENRTLIIGDELFGDQGVAAHRCVEILLCKEANRPIQFSINAPVGQSISLLRERVSTDVIGKKPGRIVLGLGIKDLRNGTDYKEVFEHYRLYVEEILSKTLSPIHILTIPKDMLPEAPNCVMGLNQLVFEFQKNSRVKIMDFAAHTEYFKEKQLERGKFGRSIYTEEGCPTSLCNTLLALFLYQGLIKELK